MKASISDLMKQLPAMVTKEYPEGEPFTTAIEHGSMSVELYAPVEVDIQATHEQDELYFTHTGSGEFVVDGERHNFQPGTMFFVPAGKSHRFENFSIGFSTWVVFWGPKGGE